MNGSAVLAIDLITLARSSANSLMPPPITKGYANPSHGSSQRPKGIALWTGYGDAESVSDWPLL